MPDLRDDLRSAYHERDDLWFEALLAKVPVAAVEPKFDPLALPLPFADQRFAQAWAEWVEYRHKRRPKLTVMSVKKQLAMLATFDMQVAIVAIQTSITNGWQGLFPEKVKPNGVYKSKGEKRIEQLSRWATTAHAHQLPEPETPRALED